MGTLGLIGYGTLGRQVEAFVRAQYPDNSFIYFDDLLPPAPNHHPFSSFKSPTFQNLDFIVCLGYNHQLTRIEIIDQLHSGNRNVISYCHQNCFIDSTSSIGKNSIIFPQCVIGDHVKIGQGVVLHYSCLMAHDIAIADGCYLAPRVTICGDVKIGRGVFIGAGSIIRDGIEIGDQATIGIGTVVTKNIPPSTSVIGNPMKMLSKNIKL